MWKLNKHIVFLQGATSNSGSLPEWASLLGDIMLFGHHLEILNDFTYLFFFKCEFREDIYNRYSGSGEVQPLSTFLPPATSLGWVPPLSAGDRDQFVCLGRAPFSLLPYEDQGLHWAYCVECAGQALAIGGLDRARMGEPTLAACLLLLLWSYLAGLFAHLQPGITCAQGWGLQSLGSYINPLTVGCRAVLWEGEIAFPDPSWGPAFSFHLRSHQSWAGPTHYWSQLGIKQQCYSHQTDQ